MKHSSHSDSAPTGYDDTPMLPGSIWRVHDGRRPQPPVVRPGGGPGQPPSDAVVLFSGKDFSRWVGRDGGAVQWTIRDDAMEVVPGSGDIKTRDFFGDCQLHIEWATPSEVKGASQGRGNSGVFLMGLYEIQVLDSYDNISYADGHAAAIYGQFPPLVNASREPGEWQNFDIFFVAPRFEENELASPAYVTLIHNGVLAHHHRAALGPTDHRTLPSYNAPHGPTGPVKLQDHGDLVRYRNIWIRSIEDYARQ